MVANAATMTVPGTILVPSVVAGAIASVRWGRLHGASDRPEGVGASVRRRARRSSLLLRSPLEAARLWAPRHDRSIVSILKPEWSPDPSARVGDTLRSRAVLAPICTGVSCSQAMGSYA